MTWMLVFILLVLVSAFTGFVARWERREEQGRLANVLEGYEAAGPLVNASEWQMHRALVRAAGERFVVMTKVRLEDLVHVKKGFSWRVRQSFRGRIKSRHVDFVLCDSTLRPVAVIELDGSSHNSVQAQKSDAFKDALFARVGIPLHRVRVGEDFAVRAREIVESMAR